VDWARGRAGGRAGKRDDEAMHPALSMLGGRLEEPAVSGTVVAWWLAQTNVDPLERLFF
jgi:hypothetical protein